MTESHPPTEPASDRLARLKKEIKTYRQEFGAVLRELREAREPTLTQTALGKAVRLDQSAVSNVEKGRNFPRLRAIWEITQFFGIPIYEPFLKAHERWRDSRPPYEPPSPPEQPRPPIMKRLGEAPRPKTPSTLPHDAGPPATKTKHKRKRRA